MEYLSLNLFAISLGWRIYLELHRSQDCVSNFVWFSLYFWRHSWTTIREAFVSASLDLFVCSFSFYCAFRCNLYITMHDSRSRRPSVNSAIADAGSPLPASGNISVLSSSSISPSRFICTPDYFIAERLAQPLLPFVATNATDVMKCV